MEFIYMNGKSQWTTVSKEASLEEEVMLLLERVITRRTSSLAAVRR